MKLIEKIGIGIAIPLGILGWAFVVFLIVLASIID